MKMLRAIVIVSTSARHALRGDAERGGKVPAAPGIRGENARDQRVAVVKPGGVAVGLTDIRPLPAANHAESYFSLWSIRCFSHNIILEMEECWCLGAGWLPEQV